MVHDNVFTRAATAHRHDHEHGHHHHHHETTGRLNLEILATFVGGTLVVVALIARYLYSDIPERGELVALAAALILGAPLVWGAFRDLIKGHAEMNELVALAVVAAIAAGEYLEAGVIAFFMILSSLIEHRTAEGARKSIESLVRITPTKARRLVEGQEEEVDASELRPGDHVRVLPGRQHSG